jgi:hypothetical protein
MRKSLIAAVSSVALGVSVLAAGASAQDFRHQDRFIGHFCAGRDDWDCKSWRREHGHWDDFHYRRFYHRHEHDFGDIAAAMIFGMAAKMGSAMMNSSHVQACKNHYRSYDPATDTFLGYDGWRHYCRL